MVENGKVQLSGRLKIIKLVTMVDGIIHSKFNPKVDIDVIFKVIYSEDSEQTFRASLAEFINFNYCGFN